MARRSVARPMPTTACGAHRCYRTQYEAMAASAWHPVTACAKCRAGQVWHIFQHGKHWHVAHSSKWTVPERCRAQHDICAPPGAG